MPPAKNGRSAMPGAGVPAPAPTTPEERVTKAWPAALSSVAPARHEARAVLTAWGLGRLTDDAEIVLSELFTNAVRHTAVPESRRIEVVLARPANGVRVEVHDPSNDHPNSRDASPEDESGRGLALVEALTASHWGVNPLPGGGKIVWALIPLPRAENS
jgi:anti-sigma regulatory factor (Ser/Thr protein kinase)